MRIEKINNKKTVEDKLNPSTAARHNKLFWRYIVSGVSPKLVGPR